MKTVDFRHKMQEYDKEKLEKMRKPNKLEVMDDSIEAMIDQIATHSGIKRQNSYVVLAHILASYSERCLKLSEQNDKKEKGKNGLSN